MPQEQNIPYGFCHCGCGQKTLISQKNHTKNGYVKGQPRKYVQHHHLPKATLASNIICREIRRHPLDVIYNGEPCIVIFLTRGFVTIIDARHREQAQHNWKVILRYGTPYAVRTSHGVGELMLHRVIDKTPTELECDHRNGFTLDNREDNLRHANDTQNACNKRGKRIKKSKYKGVFTTHGNGKPWRAAIGSGYEHIHLGSFDSELEAARAYDAAARRIHGEFAKTNFTD